VPAAGLVWLRPEGPPAVGGDFAGGDFAGGVLTGGNFAGGDFAGGNFAGGVLAGGDFAGGLLAGGDFAGGLLAGGDFAGGLLAGGDFAGGLLAGGLLGGLLAGGLLGGLLAGGLLGGLLAGGLLGGLLAGGLLGGLLAGGLLGGGLLGGLLRVLQVGVVMVSVSRVTAPLRARTRPSMVTPVVTVMSVKARMLPRNVEPVPRVAELPTCQNTLQAWAPLVSSTRLAEPVVSVDPAWNTNAAFGFPPASRVRAPLSAREEPDRYTPAVSV